MHQHDLIHAFGVGLVAFALATLIISCRMFLTPVQDLPPVPDVDYYKSPYDMAAMTPLPTVDNASYGFTPDDSGKEKMLDQVRLGQNLVIVGLAGAPDQRGSSKQRAFWLSPGTTFRAKYSVINGTEQQEEFALIMVLNYRQVPFTLDGVTDEVHHFPLANGEERIFSIETQPLESGCHDLALLLVRHSPEFFGGKEEALAYPPNVLGRRVNLYVGEEECPTPTVFRAYGDEPANPDINGYYLSREHKPSDRQGGVFSVKECREWTGESVKPGEKIPYYIHISHPNSERSYFALIAFLDYQQISLGIEDADKVAYGSMNPNTRVRLPATVVVPQEEGPHYLLVLWAYNPYAAEETEPGVRACRSIIFDTVGRVLLTVNDSP